MTPATAVHPIVNPKSSVELADFPIPEEQILEGNPQAKIWINAQSPDLKVTHGVWSCTAGSFSWDFAWDEFAMILEGEVTITPEDGEAVTLREGDFINFPLGLKTTWVVPEFIKKTFVLRTPEPLEL
jgi:hypothetical protein